MSVLDTAGKEIKQEEKQLTKKELFEKEPDRFIDMTELVCAVKREPEGKISHYIGTSNQMELFGAYGILGMRIHEFLNALKIQAINEKNMVKQFNTHKNKRNFTNFIRGKK